MIIAINIIHRYIGSLLLWILQRTHINGDDRAGEVENDDVDDDRADGINDIEENISNEGAPIGFRNLPQENDEEVYLHRKPKSLQRNSSPSPKKKQEQQQQKQHCREINSFADDADNHSKLTESHKRTSSPLPQQQQQPLQQQHREMNSVAADVVGAHENNNRVDIEEHHHHEQEEERR